MKKRDFLAILNKNSLSEKIFLFTSITIIVTLLIFIILIYTRVRTIYIDNAKTTTTQNIDLITQSMINFTSNIDDDVLLSIISADVQSSIKNYYTEQQGFYETESLISEYIHQTVNINRAILGCDILLNDGEILNISQFIHNDVANLIRKHSLDNEYEAFKWFGPYELEQFNGLTKNVFVVEKKIIGLNNPDTLGYMYMYVDEQIMSEIYSSSVHQDTMFFIIDTAGKIISAKDKIVLNKNISAVLNTGTAKSSQSLPIIDGVKSFRTDNSIGDIGWEIITITPMTSLMQSTNELFLILALFTLLSMIIGIVLSNRISKHIAKPIKDLANTMTQITEGDRTLRASVTNNAEMNILNESFNTLMDTNENLIHEIDEKHQNLRKHEFLLLQEQIKPHFLYNSLSTVSSLIKLDMNKQAIDTVSNLAKFFRISLSDGNDIITIHDEIQMLRSYIVVQQYRYKNLIDFKVDVEDSVLSHCIPKLSLQPLIENAIYHGIKPKNTQTEIVLTGKICDTHIVLSVKDFGVGMDEKDLEELRININAPNTSSFGLSCVHQRIKIMHGDTYGIEIFSKKGDFTEVTLTFPKKEGGIHV